MKIEPQNIEDFCLFLKQEGRRPATIESYSRDARRFYNYMQQHSIPLGAVEPKTLLEYQKHLITDCQEKENSVRRSIIGIRQFFRFLADSKVISSSPLDELPIPQRDDSFTSQLQIKDFDKLILTAQNSTPEIKSLRDAAILALLGFDGLKASEVIQLKWSDYLEERDHGSIKINGIKSRIVRVSNETTKLLNQYKAAYTKLASTSELKLTNMFIAFKGRDASLITPNITRHGIKFMLSELGNKTGVKHLNTENLRHHAISYLLEQGKTPEQIMDHFGLKRLGNIAKHVAQLNRQNKRKPS